MDVMFNWTAIRAAGQYENYNSWCEGYDISITQNFIISNPSDWLNSDIAILEVKHPKTGKYYRFYKCVLIPTKARPLEEWL